MSIIRKKDVYDENDRCNFQYKRLPLPTIQGYTAGAILRLSRSIFKKLLYSPLNWFTDMGILYDLNIEDEPTEHPIVGSEGIPSSDGVILDKLLVKKAGWPYATIRDYYEAYLNKDTTPNHVAEIILNICEKESVQSLNAFAEIKNSEVLEAAENSTMRYQQGRPLSVLDGVPFFVKEHISIKNYTCFYGTDTFNLRGTETAIIISKLLEAGALLIGTTTMTQLGSNPIGFNPSTKFPTPRNPWDTNRYTGGSSSGNGVVVGMGLVPFTIGSDSLGSIRIPSGFNGIVGLRPTYSRVSSIRSAIKPDAPFLTIGPMACCIGDAAIVYSVIAGPDSDFTLGLNQPALLSPVFFNFDIKKVRFGICPEYVLGADLEIMNQFNLVCDKLRSLECQVLDISIPELKETAQSTYTGMSSLVAGKTDDIPQLKLTFETSTDVNLIFIAGLGSSLTEEVLDTAKRQRTRSMNIMRKIFENVDIILTPNACISAPVIGSSHSSNGILDLNVLNGTCHYLFMSSLTGVPALSINIGYEKDTNMPISLQMLAHWWREDLLFSVGHVIEELFPLTKKPPVYENPLLEVNK